MIYHHVINNYLWGFVRLPPEEETFVDQAVLEYLGLDSQDSEKPKGAEADPDATLSENYLPVLTEQITVFKRNIPMSSRMGPVLGRSSYIDDIAHGAAAWDQLCDDLDALFLNYYHKFIEDFSVVAAVLYELTDDQVRAGRDLLRAKEAFAILKQKIVSTPMLRHPDRSKTFIIIPHANQWAACAVLGQEYDGVIQPVRFTGRVLHDAELRYHIAEKEVLAVIRVLQVFKTLVEGCPLIVYTRYSVLKWVIKSKTADGRTVPWGVALSHYDLDIRKVQRDVDGLAAIMGAGIGMALEHQTQDLVAVGDSRIVIQQVQGLINCNQPNLQRMWAECQVLKDKFRRVQLVHVKRDFNQAADYLTSKTLTLGESLVVHDEGQNEHLKVVSKIPEPIMKLPEGSTEVHPVEPVGSPSEDPGCESGPDPESAPLPFAARVLGVLTRGQARDTPDDSPPLGPLEFHVERWRRIRAHQERDEYLSEIRDFLRGNLDRFSPRRLRKIAKVADLFALDVRNVLYRLVRSTRDRPRDAEDQLRLVVSEALREDVLHYAHEDVQGGHSNLREVSFGVLLARHVGWCGALHSMNEVFTRFRELLGSKQRATLAYRPQANGPHERSVQTVIRSVKAYIAEADQSDWDEHAERLMFALNTSLMRRVWIRLVHGWDAQGTASVMLGPKPSSLHDRTAYEWRRQFQRDYSYALACAEDLQKKARRVRSEGQTRQWLELSERLKASFETGDAVWLYIPKVQPGIRRKLAHLWHGPIRIEEIQDDF
ncbi:unnamed protein product [Phytophthora fragariaefolia]|uniref:Unnamed protein product n=1 Tax=Phytophthora fragariaefolia TaxID=1490495 RepID=A0A9W6TS46_9STRA|nr:unnamed protein product [Phytophthora fragariaefolia]